MGDHNYKIEIELATKGDLDAKLGGIGKGASHAEGKVASLSQSFQSLSSAVQGFGSKIMAPMDAIASKVAGVAVGFAKLAGAAGIGLATYGVVHLNNELEKTTISLAAMMSANGLANGMGEGMKKAGSVMKDMRKDAALLPGEFGDLANIMRSALLPAAHLGMNIDQVRAMSSKVMAAGAVMGMPMDQVARETAMMLEGRVGVHNIFAQRLGIGLGEGESKKFHALSSDKRAEAITAALDKFAPSVEQFKDSFDGLSSTFVDNVKQFMGAATGPLFGRVKDTLKDLNKWLDNNEEKWKAYAAVLGGDLTKAFDLAKSKMLEWGPVVFDFANNAYSKIVGVWQQVEPVVARIAGMVKGFMSDPEAFDKIEHIAKLYAGLKVAQVAGGGVLNASSGVLGAAAGAKTLGLFGGGGSAAAAAAGGEGAAAGAGAGLGAVAAPVAVLTAALYGAVVAETEYQAKKEDSWFMEKVFHETWATLQWQFRTIMDNMATAGAGLVGALTPLAEVMGVALVGAANAAVSSLTMASEVLATIFGQFGKTTDLGTGNLTGKDTRTPQEKAFATEQQALINKGIGPQGKDTSEILNSFVKEAKRKDVKHGGGGGTHIQKVELVVTSNQDPSRIARSVMAELENIRRHPKVSRDVQDWSAP